MRALVLSILLLIISLTTPAQTPFDSFASEAYRPMLGLRELKSTENGTQQAMSQDTSVILNDDVSKWLSVDPMADKYPDISPYAYCNWNPIKFVDPEGKWIAVTSNDDAGTSYTVVGGSVDVNDCNVYVVGNDYDSNSGVKPIGANVLAQTVTPYSFCNENGKVVTGSVIDMNDMSGDAFLERFHNNEIPLYNYVFDDPMKEGNLSGRNEGNCDFKVRGDVNRGMPLSILNGKIGTARDVGNFAAGYLSGSHGIPFLLTRIAFDHVQKGIEPPVSRSAQNIGFFTGYYHYLTQLSPYGIK